MTADDLFPSSEIEVLSPRLRWMREHGIITAPPTECEPEFSSDPQADEWTACHEESGAYAHALTEFAALWELGLALGVPFYQPNPTKKP